MPTQSRRILLPLWWIYDDKAPIECEGFYQESLWSLLWHEVRGPRQILGTPQGLQTLYINAARQSQFNAVWGWYDMAWAQKSTCWLLFLHGRYVWIKSAKEKRLVLSWYRVCSTTHTTLCWSFSSSFHFFTWPYCRSNATGSDKWYW